MIPLSLAALLTAQAAPVDAPAPMLPDRGLLLWAQVVHVTPRPGLSGVPGIIPFAEFEVRTADGRRHLMARLDEGPETLIPPVGATCWIRYSSGPNMPGLAAGQPDIVEAMGCDGGVRHGDLENVLERGGAAPAAPEPDFFAWAYVLRADGQPGPPGGMFMITHTFDVRTLDGQLHRMIRVGDGLFIPPPGSICSIGFYPGRPYPGSGVPAANQVRDLDCDTGRDPEELPDGRWRYYGLTIRAVLPPPPLRHARRERYATLWMDAPGSMQQNLYFPVGEAEEGTLPQPGARCTAVIRLHNVTGRSVGHPRRPDNLGAIVESLDCDPPAAQRGNPSAR